MKSLSIKNIVAVALMAISLPIYAANYKIDTAGAHAFIQFKVSHLGYSWLMGRFNQFEGSFTFDENKPAESEVQVTINTASIDSNHAERDKHLRNEDFLNVKKFPQAKFVSTSVEDIKDDKAKLRGSLTLNGITKPVVIDVSFIGQGKDPWGGYRAGFEGTTKFKLKDFGIDYDLGPSATEVELYLVVEGIRQ